MTSKRKSSRELGSEGRAPRSPRRPTAPYASAAIGRARDGASTKRFIVEVLSRAKLRWIGREGGLPEYVERRHGYGDYSVYFTSDDGTIGKTETFSIPNSRASAEAAGPAWAGRWSRPSIVFWASQWITDRLQDDSTEDVLALNTYLVKTLEEHRELLARLSFDDCCRVTTRIIAGYPRTLRRGRRVDGATEPPERNSGRKRRRK